MSKEQKVTSNEQKVTSNEQKVTSNEQKLTSNVEKLTSNKKKLTSNEQKLTGNEQRGKSFTSRISLLMKNNNSFNEKQFTVGVFIDFSKAFDTVDHKILTKKLEKHGIKYQYLDWFKSYLNSQKQYLGYSKGTTPSEEIKSGVPQGSILDSLLF